MKKVLTITFVIATIVASAQVPQGLNYQAVARDIPSGLPKQNANINVKFTILQGSVNGTSVYSETHATQTNTFGLFTLTIGKGVSVDTFSNIDWSNGDKFLKVEIDNQLTGTTQLWSVPYALFAGNGSQWKNFVNGISYTSNIGQNLFISRATPYDSDIPSISTSEENLYLNNDRVWTRGTFTVIPVSMPNTQSNHLNFSVNENFGQIATRKSGSALAFQTDVYGGNVGIGTTNPQTRLDVNGSARAKGFDILSNNGNTLFTFFGGYGGGPCPNCANLLMYGTDGAVHATLQMTPSGQSIFACENITAPVKNFRMQYPNKPDKEIWYACIEGPEAAAYERGTTQLQNGEATIVLSEHFREVMNPATMTVQVIPLSAGSKGLAVIEKNNSGFIVKELWNGAGNYKIDWEVKAVRKGYENYKAVRNADEGLPILPYSPSRN